MVYIILKTGENTETGEPGILECLDWIENGTEEQQNEYKAKLKAIFEKAKETIESDSKVIITDCIKCEQIHDSKEIYTIDELNEYKENFKTKCQNLLKFNPFD